MAELGDLQVQVSGRRRQHARAGAIALGRAVVISGPIETAGADEGGGLRVGDFLVERFRHDANAIGDMGEREFREEVQEGTLGWSHRVMCLSV